MMDAGQTGGVRRGAPAPGVRRLEEVTLEEASAFGPEVEALRRLVAEGLPVAPCWVVRLADDPARRIAAAAELALGLGGVARLRPVLPSAAAAERCDRGVGVPRDLSPGDDALARAEELAAALRDAFGSGVLAMAVRVVACAPSPCGRALSSDPAQGGPDDIAVWTREEPAAHWCIDRRTMRATRKGGTLDGVDVSTLADLADRVQLVLGRPVQLEWCVESEQPCVAGLRFVELPTAFGVGDWRRVALVAADEGTVAALAVDALDRALGGDGGGEPAVQRIFARPYRRMGEDVTRFRRAASGAASLGRAGARIARVTGDVLAPLTAVRRFHGAMRHRLAELDGTPLASLDDRLLVEALRERHALVSQAFSLLDRGREATGAVLTALETVVGPLGRDAIGVLAAPRPTGWRSDVEARLRRLGRRVVSELGRLPSRGPSRGDLGRRWHELRNALADERPIGIDVAPDAIGASDATFRDAIARAMEHDVFPSDAARWAVARGLRARVRGRPFGRSRLAMAGSLVLLLDRVARAKGAAADDLAAALLRLRRAAWVAGERLVDRGVLEVPEDALQLQLAEIQEALRREPGAYAARARLRREDDARWSRFEAPRRVEGRVAPP